MAKALEEIHSAEKIRVVCDTSDSLKEAALSLNTTRSTLQRCLGRLDYDISHLMKGRAVHKCPITADALKEEAFNLGKSGLAKKYKVNIPVVSRWLRECGVSLPAYHKVKYSFSEEKVQEILNDSKKMYISEVANKHSCARDTVRQVCESRGHAPPKGLRETRQEKDDCVKRHIDYFISLNRDEKKSAIDIAREHNLPIKSVLHGFKSVNYNIIVYNAPESKGEIEVREYINSLGFDCDKVRLKDDEMGRFELDCFVPSKNFAVEYCGEYWHCDEHLNNKHYHQNKTDACSRRGIALLTIFESEWKQNPDLIKSMIAYRLNADCIERIYARSAHVKEISQKQAIEFCNENHIDGGVRSSLSLGLFYNDELVSVACFSSPRFGDKTIADKELVRMCTKKYTTVIGGASKIFSYVDKNFNYPSVISYCNLSYGTGNVYKNSGFKLIGHTQQPSYFYYHKNRGLLESRQKYQKHKIKDLVDGGDQMTERDIMNRLGYYTVYKCKNSKYLRN